MITTQDRYPFVCGYCPTGFDRLLAMVVHYYDTHEREPAPPFVSSIYDGPLTRFRIVKWPRTSSHKKGT